MQIKTHKAALFRLSLFFLAVITLIFMTGITKTAQADELGVMGYELQNAVKKARKSHNLVGMGVIIYKHGKLQAVSVDGFRVNGKQDKIQADNLWHTGSITKSMTATMIARLIEQGKMRWDLRIKEVFPDMQIDESWNEASLDHLLSHSSGAPANFPIKVLFQWPENEEELISARHKAIAAILAKPANARPGKQFLYSNVGYTIAGHMAEKITGKSWEELMQREVFEPIGLNSAGFGPPKPGSEQAWGHKKLFGIYLKAFNPNDNPDNSPLMGPAGSVHMTLEDLARYGQIHLDGELGKTDYLQAKTFRHLHTPKLQEYGYGWVINAHRNWAKGRAIWHNGSNTMWYAVLMIAPKTETVMAFTFNDGRVKQAEAAIGDVLKSMQIMP